LKGRIRDALQKQVIVSEKDTVNRVSIPSYFFFSICGKTKRWKSRCPIPFADYRQGDHLSEKPGNAGIRQLSGEKSGI